jgi:two-component system, chemotaxis family, CheB/CheR fusion protein
MKNEEEAPAAAGRRILVVDDNLDSAESLALLLGLQGHEVSTATDGLAAIATARSFRPEIVFLDIGLPGMDGYEVARRMRAEPDLAGAFLIAMTGYGREEDVRRAMESGFDRHLVKPMDFAELEALLR